MAVTTCSNIWIRSGSQWKSAAGVKVRSGEGWKDFKGVRSGDTWYVCNSGPEPQIRMLLRLEGYFESEPDAEPLKIRIPGNPKWDEYWLSITSAAGYSGILPLEKVADGLSLTNPGDLIFNPDIIYTIEVWGRDNSGILPEDGITEITIVYLNVASVRMEFEFPLLENVYFWSNTWGHFHFDCVNYWQARNVDQTLELAQLNFPYLQGVDVDLSALLRSKGYSARFTSN